MVSQEDILKHTLTSFAVLLLMVVMTFPCYGSDDGDVEGSKRSQALVVKDPLQRDLAVSSTPSREGPPKSLNLKVIETIEENSPLSQRNYLRGLLIKSVGVGAAFYTLKHEPVLGFLGVAGYVYKGGVSAFIKTAGGMLGGAIGKDIGIVLYGDEALGNALSAVGAACGYGLVTLLVDMTTYGFKRLLGTHKTKTVKRQTITLDEGMS